MMNLAQNCLQGLFAHDEFAYDDAFRDVYLATVKKILIEESPGSFVEEEDFEHDEEHVLSSELVHSFQALVSTPSLVGTCQELFSMLKAHAEAKQDLLRDHVRRWEELNEVQSEEMSQQSLLSEGPELARLVESQVQAKLVLESQLVSEQSQQLQAQTSEFVAFLAKAAIESPTIRDIPLVAQVNPKNKPIEQQDCKSIPDIVTQTLVRADDSTVSRSDRVKNIGRLVIGPWVGLLPQSLQVIGNTSMNSDKTWGMCLPIQGSHYVLVHLGSSLKISFRLQVIVAMKKYPCNIFEEDFSTWLAHAKLIYTTDDLCAILAPTLGAAAKDYISQACDASPEVHFDRVNSAKGLRGRGRSFHSNLCGAQVLIRANDVESGIISADEMKCIARVCIPLNIWGSETDLLKRVKAGLMECAMRRFSSGSKLLEIAFLCDGEIADGVKKSIMEIFDY